jgi:hypothetical protein
VKWFELERLSRALRVCMQVTFAAGLLITVFLSVIMEKFFAYYFSSARYYWACVVLLTLSGVCSLNILWQLIKLLKTVNNKNPFVRENAMRLNRVAASAFVISGLFLALMYFRISVFVFGIGYVFLIAGFFCLVLSGLFKKAVDYKDENDLTV